MKLRVGERVAIGGMGEVHRGILWPGRRKVAVKRLRVGRSSADLQRLHREADMLAMLEHPNIVELIAVRDDDTTPCLILEWIDGTDLDQLLSRAPISTPAALYIGREIFTALAYAHAHGVVHRDLSPANVLVSRTGDVKLTDFGLAKFIGTPPSTIRATLPYVSPEQLHGEFADHRSDLYAAGVLLYELLTGHLPFDGEGNQCARQLLSGQHEPAEHVAPWLSPQLANTLSRLLSPVATRYQSADEVLEALPPSEHGRDDLMDIVRAFIPIRSRRTRWPLALAASGIAAAGIVVGTFFQPTMTPRATKPPTLHITPSTESPETSTLDPMRDTGKVIEQRTPAIRDIASTEDKAKDNARDEVRKRTTTNRTRKRVSKQAVKQTASTARQPNKDSTPITSETESVPESSRFKGAVFHAPYQFGGVVYSPSEDER